MQCCGDVAGVGTCRLWYATAMVGGDRQTIGGGEAKVEGSMGREEGRRSAM